MVNRSLRRPNGSEQRNTDRDDSAIGSNAGSEPEQSIRIENADSQSHGDVDGTESNANGNSSGVDTVTIDPSDLDKFIADGGTKGDSTGSSNGRKRRRRSDAGTKRGERKSKAQETIEPFLLMAHTWASVLLKSPELLLTENEAKQLSDAYGNFCEYHEIPIISSKRMSEFNMIAAIVMVYGPRVVAIRSRIKEESRVKKARNVTPISQAI